jgi:hypothetical protein
MDLLYQRYASPFSFIDGMLATGRFCEFVTKFDRTVAEEKAEELNWEFWLHKVFSGTYADFKAEMQNTAQNQNMSRQTIEATVQESNNILKNFNPTE